MIAPAEAGGRDTSNQFLVLSKNGQVSFQSPLSSKIQMAVPCAMALNLAAWIVALTEPDPRDFNRMLFAIRGEPEPPAPGPELLIALEESVKLQAHYAKLLNMHDGGQRIAFENAAAWIARLRETGTLPK